MIVITAPTGHIGHKVVSDLLAVAKPLRLIVRDASKLAAEVRDRVEIVEGSHAELATVERAFDGAEALFWLAPPDIRLPLDEAYLDFTRPAAEALRRGGVRRVVSITALGRGTRWEDRAGIVTASIRMDDMIMQTGVAFRGLAMPSFMDNVLGQVASIRDKGMMFGTSDPDSKAPTTATRDMGAAAASLLADDSWSGQEEVPVLGPEDLSGNDMASIIADVLGRQVRYQQVPFDTFKEQMLGRGASESVAQGYVDMFRAKNEGMDNVAERTAATSSPTTFKEWCETELKRAML